MKNLFLFIVYALPVFFSACMPKDTCRIVIDAKNYPEDIIRLVWYTHSGMQADSILLKEGKGTVDVQVPELTELILLNCDESKSITLEDGLIPSPEFRFFTENGKKVTIGFDNNEWPAATISGGKLNNDYMRLWKETGLLRYQNFELQREILLTNDQDIQQVKNEELSLIRKMIKEKEENFIQAGALQLCVFVSSRNLFDVYSRVGV